MDESERKGGKVMKEKLHSNSNWIFVFFVVN